MATGASRTVDITALGLAAAETVLWQMAGRLHVTVVVKASFAFTLDEGMTRLEPEEILRAEVHHNKNPMRSVRMTGDLAPFQPFCDVVLTGHACAPAGATVEALSARLVVFRDVPLIDKTLTVRGDAKGAETVPFDRIPLMYERSYGGIGWEENPLGVGAGAGKSAKSPNLFDPTDPTRVAGFGPISRGWPARKRLLGAADRKALDLPIAEVPAGFDWTYYQAAPLDQRAEYLTGNEWVILDGMNPLHEHIQSYLPATRAFARIYGVADGGSGHLLPLMADILRIDTDTLTCSVTWRASFPVQGEGALGAVTIFAGVESDGHPLAWPAPPAPMHPLPPPPLDRPTAVLSTSAFVPLGESTVMLGDAPESLEDVTDLAKSFHTEEVLEASGESLSAAPPPMTQRLPSSFEIATPSSFGGHTLNLEEHVESRGPRSLPFLKPPPAPPPAPSPPSVPPDSEPAPTYILPAQVAPPNPRFGPIELVNATALTLGVVPWRLVPSRDCLTVIAKATCDLVPGGPAVLRAFADRLDGERFAEGSGSLDCVYPSDFALYKVRADVVLTGHACAKAGAAPSVEARFAFGSEDNAFGRRLLVFGDRRWEVGPGGPRASAPEPFTQMSLGHARAFGGAKFDRNPIGLGYPDRARGGPTALPNLEDPERLLLGPQQSAQPACFAPIPLAWKERWASHGRNSVPFAGFPEELDWTLFQAAPPAQQLAFLRGDEAFAIAGLRQDHPIFTGSLPGIRARCFVVRRGAPAEIALHLDTVVFDLDALTLQLVWRGTATVVDERAPDLDAIHLITESTAADPTPFVLQAPHGHRDLPRRAPGL